MANAGCVQTSSTLNFNIGVLGHIDSGKTSLAKALSTTASTAAFDKNPQSKERGITLDLGFSSFTVDLPIHLKEQCGQAGYERLQVTLVDCPGHASLIRTIIGGAQIIDLMLLVVDVMKGVQTQTAECLVIGEMACPRMVVVLNKTDLLPAAKRQGAIDKMSKRLHKTLENTSEYWIEVAVVSLESVMRCTASSLQTFKNPPENPADPWVTLVTGGSCRSDIVSKLC
ncbi:UNVERIFIED_CONTAM: hypothetical protein FKN15_043654 [Acipenser sinensis]